jgi:hypothetical protein
MKPTQPRNYPLTKQQIETLKITYKFRFITAVLLAKYRHLKSDRSARLNLEELVKKDYLLKRYEKSYRLAGKGASYCLSTKALNFLRTEQQINTSALHAMRNNINTSQSSVDEHIELMAINMALSRQYPEIFSQFARVELITQDYFPKQRPDIYLRRNDYNRTLMNEYFVYNLKDALLFQNKKRLKPLLVHFEQDGWDGDYPTVLLICNTQAIANRVTDYLVDLELEDNFHCLLTTRLELLNSKDSKTWFAYNSEQEPTSLA